MKLPDTFTQKYELIRALNSKPYYVKTWQAKRADGQPVILKLMTLIVRDDYGYATNIIDKMKALVHDLDLMSQSYTGLAPWLDELWIDDAEVPMLVLSRPYYEKRLLDDISLDTFATPTQHQHLIQQLTRLADSLEIVFQSNHKKCLILPTNLMLDNEGNWILTDHSIWALHELIEDSSPGPRPVLDAQCYQHFMYDLMLRKLSRLDTIDLTFMLASTYYYLRLGHGVFESPNNIFKTKDFRLFAEDDNAERMDAFADTGRVQLDNLPDSLERNVLERALSPQRPERFTSTADFLTALKTLA